MIDFIGELKGYQLIKCPTYMNNSGKFIREFLQQNGIPSQDLLVIHDDWAFEVGDFRIQFGRGHNRHQGVQGVITALQTKDFWRVRIGIGERPSRIDATAFVLSDFRGAEIEKIRNLQEQIVSEIKRLF